MDEAVLALEGAVAPMACFVDDRERASVLAPSPTASTAPPSCCGRASRAASSRRCQRTTLAELVAFASRHREPTTGDTWLTSRSRTSTSRPATSRSSRAWTSRPHRRDPRADGPQRLRQVDAGERRHGPPEPRGDRGPDPLPRRGHHRGRPGRARPRRPVHGLPVPGRDPGRDRHQVPADGHERPPRGARRARDLAQGLPQDRRGGDGAHERPARVLQPLPQRGLLRRREEAHGDPPARAAAAEPRRPRRDRLGPRHRRAQHRRPRRQHGRRRAPTWAS